MFHVTKNRRPKSIAKVVVALSLGLLIVLGFGMFTTWEAQAEAASRVGSTARANVPAAVPTSPSMCPEFPDVPPTNPFYSYVTCLACRGVIGGYGDGYFRPNNNVTRGQIAKMLSLSAKYLDTIASGTQTFHDVEPGSPFYVYVERISLHGVISGYSCDSIPSEPCDSQNRPYYRPNDLSTRQQVAKIVVLAQGFTPGNRRAPSIPAAVPTADVPHIFADVLPGSNSFFAYIELLALQGTVSGYDCGGVNPINGDPEPCDGAHRKYFRPANNMSRGQISKVLSLTFFPGCQTTR